MNIKKLLFIFLICNISTIAAQNIRYGLNDMHGSSIPLDIVVLTEDSVPVTIKQIINKPTLLAFVYYECPGLCSTILDGIAEVINKSKLNLGTDYQVMVLSIQNTEKPSLARLKKKNYLKLLRNKNGENGWKFLTADSIAIAKITNSSGFEFKKKGNLIIHPAELIVISTNGKICRYLHGTYYLPMEMEMAVADAKNEIADASRIKSPKICYGKNVEENNASNTFIIICYVIFAFILFGVLYWMLKIKLLKN